MFCITLARWTLTVFSLVPNSPASIDFTLAILDPPGQRQRLLGVNDGLLRSVALRCSREFIEGADTFADLSREELILRARFAAIGKCEPAAQRQQVQ